MNYGNNYCVSKDFLRNAYPIFEGISFSLNKSREEKNALFYLLPIMRAISGLSEEYAAQGSSQPLCERARSIERGEKKKIAYLRRMSGSHCLPYSNEAELILKRMTEELRFTEISERINIDYSHFMLALLRGKARLAELLLRSPKCRHISSVLTEEMTGCRGDIRFFEDYLSSVKY